MELSNDSSDISKQTINFAFRSYTPINIGFGSDSNVPEGLNSISGTVDESLTRLGIGQGQFKTGNDFLASIIGPTETLQKYADDGKVIDKKLRRNGWFSDLFGIKI